MSSSKAQLIASLPEGERLALFSKMTPQQQEALIYDWDFWSRPEQRPPTTNPNRPDGKWRTWLLTAGRGFGKTRTASEWVRAEIESCRRRNIGIIGPTRESTRKVMVEGVSGILSVCPPWNRPTFEPSNSRIVWPNGAMAHLYTAEEPEKLRGPNLDSAWVDELCAFGSPAQAADVYDMLSLCLRIPGPKGDAPQEIITTTPKPMPLLRQIIKNPNTVRVGGSTFDNEANLDSATLAYLKEKYGGTRLGRQELQGEVLDAFEGALWTPAVLERNRLPLTGPDAWRIHRGDNSGHMCLVGPRGELVYFQRIIVSIDPAGSANRKSNETGLMVCALGDDEDGYLLADHSGVYSPEQWGSLAVELFYNWQADKIIAEQNYGGDMVASTIRAADRNVPVRLVVASKGKKVRAEPISLLDENDRIHHVGQFPKLEDQLVTWDPMGKGESPDRLDARVWGFLELMLRRKSDLDAGRGVYRGPIPIYGR